MNIIHQLNPENKKYYQEFLQVLGVYNENIKNN
jgi:hypothetical protein